MPGGVGRNVADCLARLGHDPLFITVIGDDLMGHFIRQNSQHMDRSGMILIEKSATASIFVLVDGNGEVKCQVGDIRILKRFDHEKVCLIVVINSTYWLCLDATLYERN